MIAHQIPIALLNACQSGKQIGASETSLGSRLMQAGVQMVLAMGYSVTVTAAELLIRTLYQQLFSGQDLASAIRRGRLELFNQKGRRAYFNQMIDLEDWLLPVVYQNRAVLLRPRELTPAERAAFYERQAQRFAPAQPSYGFFGRDLDILQIERQLLARRNILLVRGMGGAGKTTLLRHLGVWWQTTGLVDQVFSYGYDERAWTRQQILDAIARQIYSQADYYSLFQPLSLAAQQAMLAAQLRSTRHLLILDNLESITGAQLAIQHTLPEEERVALRRFLIDLAGGKTLVLLGSRGGEAWLAAETFGDNIYDLPGLDPEAASLLTDEILKRSGTTPYRQTIELQYILQLLSGYPLALEVVLSNLTRQTPAQVLEALLAGDVDLDMPGSPQDKTQSILRCIDYSHSNLSSAAQALLSCLAPFTSVIFVGLLDNYTTQLRAQPALATLPFEQWQSVLAEATNWGLVAPHPQMNGFLTIQPTLPYFLRNRLQEPEQAELRRAVEAAFTAHYAGMGNMLNQLITSKDAREKQAGQALIKLEYENLITALNLALRAQGSITKMYVALDEYWKHTQDTQHGIDVGTMILAQLETYSREALSKGDGFALGRVLTDLANRQLTLKQYDAAEKAYLRSLEIVPIITVFSAEQRALLSAASYYQLGMVAQEQRQWAQAEQYSQQALHIAVEYNNRYHQALPYHQLGRIAQEQRQWAQAEQYYQQALQIYVEYNDRYEQASTYHQLGGVAQEQRQWAQAEQYYQQALQIKIDYNNRYEQASTYHQLGRVAQEQHQWMQAEQYFQQALHIAIEYNDRYHQASPYHNLGIVAQEQQQWAQAEQYFQQALQIKIDYNDRYEQASTYHQLGMVAQEQRQWAQSEQYYQQALQIKIEYNARYQQASTYHQLGVVAEEQQQWEQAREYFLSDLEITAASNNAYGLEITLGSLARLWQASGDSSLPAAVAAVLGVTAAEAEERLRGDA